MLQTHKAQEDHSPCVSMQEAAELVAAIAMRPLKDLIEDR